MASLRLSYEFSLLFNAEVSKCYGVENILELFSTPNFTIFFDAIKTMLHRYHYVHISNVGFAPRRDILGAFASCFGSFRDPVENTNVRIDCSFDGCSIESLPLHNDDAMLDIMPQIGILQVENECPLKMPKNGIVLIKDIVFYLQLHNERLLQKLLTHKIPMLSSKFSKIIKNNETVFLEKGDEVIAEKSILIEKNGIYEARFNPSRIDYYYYKTGKKQSLAERKMIFEFLEIANRFKKSMYLKENDILIYNNKQTLHDRTESGLEFGLADIKSRSFYIAFAN